MRAVVTGQWLSVGVQVCVIRREEEGGDEETGGYGDTAEEAAPHSTRTNRLYSIPCD